MKAKRYLVIAGLIAAAAILVMALYVFVISPKLVEPADTYSKAVKLYNNDDYMRAALMFESLKNYSDAEEQAKRAWKSAGDAAYEAGNYENASACYTRCGSEEDLGKVDDCFLRLAKEEFKKLDPVKGEIYLNAVSNSADPKLGEDARIEGARIILRGTDDEKTAAAAVNLLEPCSAERAEEICELLAGAGENYIKKLNIDAAEPVLSAAAGYCPEGKLTELNARFEKALLEAGDKAKQAEDDELYERIFALAELYKSEEEPEPPEETDEDRIERASALVESGDYTGAYAILSKLPKDNAAVNSLLETVLYYFRRMPCAGAKNAYVVLGTDGKAEFIGEGWGEGTPSWTDCAMVAMGYDTFALCLKKDGTVEAFSAGNAEPQDVEEWTDIIQIAAGSNHSLGLRKDGTVVIAGKNDSGMVGAAEWTDIVCIAAGRDTSYGVKKDGTVVAAGADESIQREISAWHDIIAVNAGRGHVVGLCKDGTVVACGGNTKGQCEVGSWTDIVMICAVANQTVGLRADGTVVACGENVNGCCEVSGVKNAVAVACGHGYTLVVYADCNIEIFGKIG